MVKIRLNNLSVIDDIKIWCNENLKDEWYFINENDTMVIWSHVCFKRDEDATWFIMHVGDLV